MRKAIPVAITKAEAQVILDDPEQCDRLAPQASVLFQTDSGVIRQRITAVDPPPLDLLHHARRIGTYKGARNVIGTHPTLCGGRPRLLPTESKLELAWFRTFSFQPTTRALFSQPFAVVWPVKDRCMWRIPDLLLLDDRGHVVVDVKPEDPEIRTPYVLGMLNLTRRTFAIAGWRTFVAGSLNANSVANLLDIFFESRPIPELADAVARVRASRPATLGGILDIVGDDDDGMCVALHLLANELVADLSRPLLLGTRVTWT